MKIAAIQHDVIWESPSANHERLTPMVAQAASGGAELVVLSEMYSTGFSMACRECKTPRPRDALLSSVP